MTTPELPPLPNPPLEYRHEGCTYIDRESFLEWHDQHSARERILHARVAELQDEAGRRTREVEATYLVQKRLNERVAELQADAERAWIRANRAESKVAAWERTMVVVGLPTRIEPGVGWGPGGGDPVEVPSLTPEKMTSILDRLARAEARVAANDDALSWIGELMAVMHADGGHYLAKHGMEKAIGDAMDKYHAMHSRVAQLEKDLADCFRLTGADPDSNEDWRLARWVAELEAERERAWVEYATQGTVAARGAK